MCEVKWQIKQRTSLSSLQIQENSSDIIQECQIL